MNYRKNELYIAPTRPKRPEWNTEEVSMNALPQSWTVLADFVKIWTQLANSVDEIFRYMHGQIERLGFSEDDYAIIIWMFGNHPIRPTLHGIEHYQEEQIPLIKEFVQNVLAKFDSRWTEFADRLEITHTGIANEPAQCRTRLFNTTVDSEDLGVSASFFDVVSTCTQL